PGYPAGRRAAAGTLRGGLAPPPAHAEVETADGDPVQPPVDGRPQRFLHQHELLRPGRIVDLDDKPVPPPADGPAVACHGGPDGFGPDVQSPLAPEGLIATQVLQRLFQGVSEAHPGGRPAAPAGAVAGHRGGTASSRPPATVYTADAASHQGPSAR